MSQRVPNFPIISIPAATTDNRVRIATPVRGADQWGEWSRAVNWLNGTGGSVGTQGNVYGGGYTSGTYTVPFYYRRRLQHDSLLVCMSIYCSDLAAGTVDFGASQIYDWSVDSECRTFEFIISSTPGSKNASGSFDITNTYYGSAQWHLLHVGIYELPRGVLDAADDTHGTHETSAMLGAPIYDPGDGKTGTAGLAANVELARTDCRRQSMFSFARDDDSPITITAGSYTNLFTIDPAIQARHLVSGATVGEVSIAVRSQQVGGGSTSLRFTAASGDTATVTISAASYSWQTVTLDVETDDFSRSDTIRGGTRDSIAIEGQLNSGTRGEVTSIFIGEA